MAAYVIGNISVKDAEKWAEYKRGVPATIVPFGGELVLRGHRKAVLGGEHRHTDTVVIRFPAIEAVDEWFHSDAYQQLIPLRLQAADVDLISYEAAL